MDTDNFQTIDIIVPYVDIIGLCHCVAILWEYMWYCINVMWGTLPF